MLRVPACPQFLTLLPLLVPEYTKKWFFPFPMHRSALTGVTQSVGRHPVLQNKRSQVWYPVRVPA